jgi:hypothetical protein
VWLGCAIALPTAVAMSASRTGLVELAVVALWSALDRALRPEVRRLAMAAPLIGLLAWAMLSLTNPPAASRDVDRGTLRTDLVHGAWALIREDPWIGVGWDELGTAWALSDAVVPNGRPIDDAHNLPLQLAAELGVPLATWVTAMLALALWKAWQRSRAGPERLLVLIALVVAMHSMVEFPLWFAYFLLPTAWALGIASTCGQAKPPSRAVAPGWNGWSAAGAALTAASFVAFADFARALPAALPESDPMPLEERIERARHSRLFFQLADSLAATRTERPPIRVFDGARHVAIDAELLVAWSRALMREGDAQAARHVAQRALSYAAAVNREHRIPCEELVGPGIGIPCGKPERAWDWRALR